LLASTAALSVMMPNAITAITVLPIVTLLQRQWLQHGRDHQARISTALALAVIYGANIGGIGSITGTPANGILVAYTAVQGVQTEAVLRFDTWLPWGLPLVATLVILGWAVIMLTLARQHAAEPIEPLQDWTEPPRPAHRQVLWLSAAFLAVSFGLSAAMHYTDPLPVLAATGILSALFIAGLFLVPWRTGPQAPREPLLRPRDVATGLPLRGLLFVLGFVVLATSLAALGAIDAMARVLSGLLPADIYSYPAHVLLALVTSFTTEALSNTVVQLGMFETLFAHAGGHDRVIYPLLTVTLSCTCAFMSPVATGVNGLVFGEMRGASLWRMLLAGLLMNVVAALTIAAWVRWLVP